MPEIGWSEVELTEAGAADSVFSALPARFEGFIWHHYAHDLPEGGVALAHSAASLQAFRLGDTCWGVQFHPEVTEPQLGRWIGDEHDLSQRATHTWSATSTGRPGRSGTPTGRA